MIRLLQIDLLKMRRYKTFWILIILYFATLGLVTSSGMEFLKWLASKGADFDRVDILRVPLYHFPDIWQNLTYVSTYFQLVLAVVVVVAVTNEFSYKTIRQNIIDGIDRKDFLLSKVLFIALLALSATLFVFLIGIVTGSIYSPASEMRFMFRTIEFIPGFFLATFSYLLLVLLLSVMIKRAGLALGITIIYPALEYTLTASLPDVLDPADDFFPLHAINNLIHVPFQRYIFLEIQDYVSLTSSLVAIAYCFVFIYLSYQILSKRDLN